ncbi:phosphotransferase enzyme family protein [Streptomyces sp. NBC_00859]|uniref:phosphotransferase enzyme family protein n=1 Tax=Streptomyces sp. NBC_00859 TaxID=2903682 RepID=UPI0038661546|nr:phosphotransferase [Streptomyces sp. NBC_00859]
MDTDRLRAVLARWDGRVASIENLAGGWNSTTWLVHLAGRDSASARYVAKLADSGDADAFRGGLRVARAASSHGFPSGPPIPARDGTMAVELPEGILALLEYLPGRPPDTASMADVRRVGETLARAHLVLRGEDDELGERFAWPWPWANHCLQEIPMPAKVRAAAARALEQARNIPDHAQLRVGVVHGDPGLDGFRLREERADRLDGLVDWSAAMQAPLLYDLGCLSVITRHEPHLLPWALDGYLRVLPDASGELVHLDAFVKLRWMCNAVYFAARLESGITRGAGSAAENQKGLAEAYEGLTAEPAEPHAAR